MIAEIVILVVGLLILILGGEVLVRGASSLALRADISPLVVGLTVVAFGTSAPELLISIKAAIAGSPDMTMGNVVGSNICNLALVLGVAALIRPITVKADSVKIDWPVAMGSSVLLYFVAIQKDAAINFFEGIIFVLLLLLYIVYIISKSRKETRKLRDSKEEVEMPEVSENLFKDLSFIAVGCAGLYFGAGWFVGGAQEVAYFLGVSERVIGITVLALGTSLPELVTAIVASVRQETDLALGNLMGSNIFNILSILGITSIIKDIQVGEQIIHHDMIAMLIITFMILPLMLYKRKIARLSGMLLLASYLFYTYTVIS